MPQNCPLEEDSGGVKVNPFIRSFLHSFIFSFIHSFITKTYTYNESLGCVKVSGCPGFIEPYMD